jgi:hypothetical protein
MDWFDRYATMNWIATWLEVQWTFMTRFSVV